MWRNGVARRDYVENVGYQVGGVTPEKAKNVQKLGYPPTQVPQDKNYFNHSFIRFSIISKGAGPVDKSRL